MDNNKNRKCDECLLKYDIPLIRKIVTKFYLHFLNRRVESKTIISLNYYYTCVICRGNELLFRAVQYTSPDDLNKFKA